MINPPFANGLAPVAWRIRTFALLACLAVLAGCTIGPVRGPDANQVDDDRLAIVSASPLLSDAELRGMGGQGEYNTSYTPERTVLRIGLQRALPHDAKEAWAANMTQLRAILDDGWKPTAVQCLQRGDLYLLATKDYGDFSAALVGQLEAEITTLNVFIPFHTESPNPWTPAQPLPGSTCADAEQPPGQDTPPLPEHNYIGFFWWR
jgi:hypothetical protein